MGPLVVAAVLVLAILVAAIVAAGAGWIAAIGRLRRAHADCAAAIARLAELEAQTAVLRHDIRGILSPALLTADRLLRHADPVVKKAGDTIVRTVERTTARLAETKGK